MSRGFGLRFGRAARMLGATKTARTRMRRISFISPPPTCFPQVLRPLLVLLAFGFGMSRLLAAPVPVPGPRPQAPPPTPPIEHATGIVPPQGHPPKPEGTTLYSIGEPTDEEQLYLEYLNRMRANPTAEGQRLATTSDPSIQSAYASFNVDLSLMQSEFATNPAVPPLAMNAKLTAAARWHSGDMLTNQYQGHYQTNGSVVMSPGDRIATNGYSAGSWGENVFSYAESVPQGHAAFAVDWGGGVGGMQTPPGHRDNMLTGAFREVGVGVIDGVNGSVGPQLVTEDFATQLSSTPFVTGVVYFDLNGNGFYDLGEGIGGVTVNSAGSSYYTITADSGGYALPVPGNGTYILTFTAPGLSTQVTATIGGLQNTKIDLKPVYSPPTVSGPNPASLNQNNGYNISAVPGATAYQWEQAQLAPYTLVEGAENGLGNVTAVTSAGYSVISTFKAASGTHSFNLMHSQAADQILTLNPILLVSAASQFSFSKFIGFALSNEVSEAQISSDGGLNWQTLWSQPGNAGASAVDTAFTRQTLSLAAYAGKIVQVRFVYAYNGGLYFNSGSGLGLYVDDISVSGAQQVIGAATNGISSGTSFTFNPKALTNYLLAARAQINTRTLPWGPAFTVGVTTSAPPAVVQLAGPPSVSGNQVQITFNVSNFRTGMSFQLLRASDLPGTWSQDTTATLQTVAPNSQFRFTTTTAGTHSFFRVKGG